MGTNNPPRTPNTRVGRRTLLALAASALIRPAAAGLRAGSFRIGILFAGAMQSRDNPWLGAFIGKLEDLGYVEGKNISFEIRATSGEYDRLPGLARELLALRPDVIFVTTTPALMAIYKAQPVMPVIFTTIGNDPIALGVAQSLPHPGGNLTGITNNAVELNPKRMQMLRDLLPGAKRLAYFSNPKNPGSTPAHAKALDDAGARLGFQVVPIDVTAANDIPGAFDKAAELNVEALFGSADPLSIANRQTIIRLALERKLPAIYNFRLEVADGGLISYGPDMEAQYRAAAIYVDKVLTGEKPADLPIEQATKLALYINLTTARALGLEIPRMLLARADEILE